MFYLRFEQTNYDKALTSDESFNTFYKLPVEISKKSK